MAAVWDCWAGGPRDPDRLARELPIAADGTDKPWGVGFQIWAIDVGTAGRALEQNPAAVMLSFGDPSPVRTNGPPGRRGADHPGHRP
jgi:hypothetical protein